MEDREYREYRANAMIAQNKLRHFGILGMKWGIRRYQNKDGSLTEAGRKRYSVEDVDNKDEKQKKEYASDQQKYYYKEIYKDTYSKAFDECYNEISTSKDKSEVVKNIGHQYLKQYEIDSYIKDMKNATVDEELEELITLELSDRIAEEKGRDSLIKQEGYFVNRSDSLCPYTSYNSKSADSIMAEAYRYKYPAGGDSFKKNEVSFDEYLNLLKDLNGQKGNEYVDKALKAAKDKLTDMAGSPVSPRIQVFTTGNMTISFTDSGDSDWMMDIDMDKDGKITGVYWH